MGIYDKTKPKSMCFGKSIIKSIFFGDNKVWPSDYEITLNKYSVSVLTGASWATILVTANTSSWYVQTDTNWLTAAKISNTQCNYEWTDNTGDERTGHLLFMIDGVEYARCEVRQVGVVYYFTISPTQATGLTEQSHSQVVNVDTNVPSWNVYEDLDWVSFTKNSTAATLSILANNSSGRTGNVTFSGGGFSETFYISQKGGYYMRLLSPSNPATAATAGGNVSISFISTYQDNPYTAITSSVTYNTGSGWATFVSRSQNGNIITYTFNLAANTDTAMNRVTTFRFDQDAVQSSQFLVVSFTQAKAETAPTISGFTRFAFVKDTYNNYWQLGTYDTGTRVGPNADQPLRACAIVSDVAPSKDFTATYDIGYTYYAVPPPTSQSTSGTRTIAQCVNPETCGTKITIPSGGTCYGVTITANPNMMITGGTFSVS